MLERTYPTSAIRKVCDGISARYIQHLRDRGAVRPAKAAGGRGRPAEYTRREIVQVYLIWSTFQSECWDIVDQILLAYDGWLQKTGESKEKAVVVSLSPLWSIRVDFSYAQHFVNEKLLEWDSDPFAGSRK